MMEPVLHTELPGDVYDFHQAWDAFSGRRLMDQLAVELHRFGVSHVSAPVFGVPERVVVIEEPPIRVDDKPSLLYVANPVIAAKDELGDFHPVPPPGWKGSLADRLMPCEYIEHCLAFAGGRLGVGVIRPAVIRLSGLDYYGKPFERVLHGRAARDIQHEVDHLHGITFLERVGAMKRKAILKAVKS